jgi:hypothetical protein
LPVKASEDFAFTLLSSHIALPTVRNCNLTVSFRPQPNAKYRARYLADGTQCSLSLTRVATQNGQETELPEPSLKQRTYKTPLTESGSFCEPQ